MDDGTTSAAVSHRLLTARDGNGDDVANTFTVTLNCLPLFVGWQEQYENFVDLLSCTARMCQKVTASVHQERVYSLQTCRLQQSALRDRKSCSEFCHCFWNGKVLPSKGDFALWGVWRFEGIWGSVGWKGRGGERVMGGLGGRSLLHDAAGVVYCCRCPLFSL